MKNRIVPNQKKTEVPHQSIFLFGWVLVIGRRDYWGLFQTGKPQNVDSESWIIIVPYLNLWLDGLFPHVEANLLRKISTKNSSSGQLQ